jgi:hypothetical protein
LAATRTPIGAEQLQNSHLSEGAFGFFGSLHSLSGTICISNLAQTHVIEVDGVRAVVRFVGRKGRLGRIMIEAPAGAVLPATDRSRTR